MKWRKLHEDFIVRRIILAILLIILITVRLSVNNGWMFVSFWISTVIQIGIALLLIYIIDKFHITRKKTLLPALFYFLATGINSQLSNNLIGSISALNIVLCLLFLFHSYQNPQSQGYAFNISLLLTLNSLYWRSFIFFFPVFWYGMYYYQSFNFKTFLASLMGWFMTYLFIFTWSIHVDDLTIFIQALPDFSCLNNDIRPLSFSIVEWVFNILIALLFVFAGVRLFIKGPREKVIVRTALNYLYILAVIIFILYLIQYQWANEWQLILYIPLSILLTYCFTSSD